MLLWSQFYASHGRDSLTLGHDSELKRPREVAGVLSRFKNTGEGEGSPCGGTTGVSLEQGAGLTDGRKEKGKQVDVRL